MSLGVTDLYDLPATRTLLRDEAASLRPDLAGLAGSHGLVLAAHDTDVLPPTPMLRTWVRLRVRGRSFEGDVRARFDEPLPFRDDAFRVVLLSHVLETAAHPHELMAEAARVLAPGGLLVLTGFHPFSAWTPWLWWRGRRGGCPRMAWPGATRARLARLGMQPYAVRRVGRALPLRMAVPDKVGAARGGFVLLACKRNQAVTPLRLPPVRIHAPVSREWAPGAHRECA